MMARMITSGMVVLAILTMLAGQTRAGTVADFVGDFANPSPAPGWEYLWNSGGAIGNPANYSSLSFCFCSGREVYTTDGTQFPTAAPGQFTLIGLGNVHPGPGLGPSTGDPQGFARYAIAAFTVSSAGAYSLVGTLTGRGDLTGAGNGFELLVNINGDAPLLNSVFGDNGAFDATISNFDLSLG